MANRRRKKMRRYVFSTLALALLFAFTNCKSTVSSNSPTAQASVHPSPTASRANVAPSPSPSVQQPLKGDIDARVAHILVDQLGVDEKEIKPTARLADDLGADDLDQVEVMMRLEDEFRIEIPDQDAEKLKTVGDLVNYIKKKMQPQKPTKP